MESFTLEYARNTSVHTGHNASAQGTAETLWAVDSIRAQPINDAQVLLSHAENGAACVLDSGAWGLLSQCTTFNRLSGHIKQLAARFALNPAQQHACASALHQLQQTGLLTADRALHAASPTHSAAAPKALPWCLAVHSRDRPQALERLLDSARAHLQGPRPADAFIFIDDSRAPENLRRNRAVLQAWQGATGVHVLYRDRRDCADWVTAVAREQPKLSQAMHFLLNPLHHPAEGITSGCAKNFIQLLCAQRHLLMVDDDAVLQPHALHCSDARHSEDATAPVFAAIRPHFRAFADWTELNDVTEKLDLNPLQVHLDALNSDWPTQVRQALARPEALYGLSAADARTALTAQRIGLTLNNPVGAHNARRMDAFFAQDDAFASRERFLQNHGQDTLEQLSWQGPLRDQCGRDLPFINTTLSGLAASSLPTPTLPCGRNQDLILGAMHQHLHRDALVHRFGWALPHRPDSPRYWQPLGPQQCAAFDPHMAWRLLLQDLVNIEPEGGPQEQLQRLAEHMQSLGRAQAAQANRRVADWLAQYHAHELRYWLRVETLSRDTPLLHAEVQRICQHKQARMQSDHRRLSEHREAIQALFAPMGQALSVWPALVEACRARLEF